VTAVWLLYQMVKHFRYYSCLIPIFQFSLWNVACRFVHKLTSDVILEIASSHDLITLHILTLPFEFGRLTFDVAPILESRFNQESVFHFHVCLFTLAKLLLIRVWPL